MEMKIFVYPLVGSNDCHVSENLDGFDLDSGIFEEVVGAKVLGGLLKLVGHL